MNLVDAIRQATKRTEDSAPVPGSSPAAAVSANPAEGAPMNTTQQIDIPVAGVSPVQTPNPIDPAVAAASGSLVRLELFLSPEQMHQMLRGILQGAHSVMTLREAAQHLRVNQKTLITMAESGEIPGFMVQGEWKFSRQAIDEWITIQGLRANRIGHQEDAHAA